MESLAQHGVASPLALPSFSHLHCLLLEDHKLLTLCLELAWILRFGPFEVVPGQRDASLASQYVAVPPHAEAGRPQGEDLERPSPVQAQPPGGVQDEGAAAAVTRPSPELLHTHSEPVLVRRAAECSPPRLGP